MSRYATHLIVTLLIGALAHTPLPACAGAVAAPATCCVAVDAPMEKSCCCPANGEDTCPTLSSSAKDPVGVVPAVSAGVIPVVLFVSHATRPTAACAGIVVPSRVPPPTPEPTGPVCAARPPPSSVSPLA